MGLGVLIAGVLLLILAGLFRLAAGRAMKEPIVHDGVGGKDTDNLITGCLGSILYIGFGIVGMILAIIGGVLMLVI